MMRAFYQITLLVLLTAGLLSGQATSVWTNHGGGGAAGGPYDLETDGVTGIADGEVFKGTGANAGAYINILAGIGEDLGTSNCVLFESAGSLGCDTSLAQSAAGSVLGDGTLTVSDPDINNAVVNIDSAFNGPSNAYLSFSLRNASNEKHTAGWVNAIFDNRTVGSEDGRLRFSVVNNGSFAELINIGGSQTFLCQDQTGVTGDTNCVVKAGAGQSANPFDVQLNGGGSLLAVHAGGGVDIGDGGTKPTCDSSKRGVIWVDESGAGVADTAEICLKNAADAYAWTAIASP